MDGDGDGMADDDMSKADCTHTLGERDRDFTGSSGNDVICGNDRNNNSLDGRDGDDTIRGEGGNDVLKGENGNDMLYGGAGKDELYGGPGNDELHGEAGDDTLDGGADKDELYGGPGDDTFIDDDLDGIDTFEGGEGTDTLDYSMIDQAALNGDLTDIYWHIDLAAGETGKGTLENITGGVAELLDYISGIENVMGADGLNHLVGDEKNNVLTGGMAAADKIKGMGGDDTIDGGGSTTDTDQLLDGGAGNDTLIVGEDYDLSSQTTNPKAPAGIRGFENLAVRAEVSGIELTGDGNANTLTGGAGANTLDGGDGNDTLNGGPETDMLTGGKGADTFIIVNGEHGDTIADYSGTVTNGQGDKIYLKGFSAEQKKAGFEVDDSVNNEPTRVTVGSDTVVILSNNSDGSKVKDSTVTVMFKD